MFRISLCVFSVVAAGSTEPPLHNTRSGRSYGGTYERAYLFAIGWRLSWRVQIRGYGDFSSSQSVSACQWPPGEIIYNEGQILCLLFAIWLVCFFPPMSGLDIRRCKF
jgi:hypothetical protein